MSIAKRIANSRQHLSAGNEYSYKALMAADLRSAMSTRATNAILSALKEDGYSISTNCPLPENIVKK
jgi:hypothetical protein